MDEFIELSSARGAAADSVCLDFRHREKTRQRARLESGEAIAILLPRGTRLRAGDVIVSRSGRRVAVAAAPESVSTVRAPDASALARVAYHLGNRHVRLQVGDGWVRYLADHVLDAMVLGLGAEPEAETAPFEPEPGAYHTDAGAPTPTHAHGHAHAH
jgi:urease accessory protein